MRKVSPQLEVQVKVWGLGNEGSGQRHGRKLAVDL